MYLEFKIGLCHLRVSYNLRKFTKGRWENPQFDEIIDHLNANVERLLIKISYSFRQTILPTRGELWSPNPTKI